MIKSPVSVTLNTSTYAAVTLGSSAASDPTVVNQPDPTIVYQPEPTIVTQHDPVIVEKDVVVVEQPTLPAIGE